MHMHMLNNMNVTAETKKVLEKLKENRAEHSAIVKEAREGYMDQAEAALQKRLVQLREGKLVSLHFSLQPPQDHSDVYDTAIGMVEAHTEETIVLGASQFRSLMMDEWDWTAGFLASNSGYSALAAEKVGASR